MNSRRPLPVRKSAVQKLQGLRVTVVGLGSSGISAVETCLAHGAVVSAADEKAEADVPMAPQLRQRGVSLWSGPFHDDVWKRADAIIVSPGVPLSSTVLQHAMQAGVPVVGEVELAMALKDENQGITLGITGTNGKSTTTALTGSLCQRQGKNVFVGGNLGLPLTEATRKFYDTWVVELSSFQLEGIVEARFNGAAWLNLTPDHLDRYPDAEAYGAAKARIFENQHASDFAVVNAEDDAVMAWAAQARVPVYGFSLGKTTKTLAGLAVPHAEGFSFTFGERLHFQLNNRALRGKHNLQNAMAASLLAHLAGVSEKAIQEGLDTFPGLPHRLEWVRLLEGVEWINDSKATNVDSAIVAMKALEGPVWLIAGGKGKGASYEPLVQASRGKLRGVLTVGQDAPLIEAAFASTCPVFSCVTLQVAVEKAKSLARAGELVLLSPACASYDQFRNFEDRGNQFKAWVKSL